MARPLRGTAALLGALALTAMTGGDARAAGELFPQTEKGASEPFTRLPPPNPSNSKFKAKRRLIRCRDSEFDPLADPDQAHAFACVKFHIGPFSPNCPEDWRAVQVEGKDYCLYPEARRHKPQCPGRTALKPGRRIVNSRRDTCDPKFSTKKYPRCRLPGTSMKVDAQGTEDVCLPVRRDMECERNRSSVHVSQQTSVDYFVDQNGKRDRCVRRGYVFRPPVLR